jgi:translation initiation factor 4G
MSFDNVSDQITAWANKSRDEKDARTLIQVIRIVLEKMTDGTAWSEICARLCQRMMEQISPDVQARDIRNAEGKVIAGGATFPKVPYR